MDISQIISQINPTPAFLLSLVPLPLIITLNVIIFYRLVKVHKLSHHHQVKKPSVYKKGLVFNSSSAIFVYAPAVIEWRIFVKDPRWMISYSIGALLSIVGLIMIVKGLNLEINSLTKHGRVHHRHERKKLKKK
jgi:archaellum biogenesis protein FlaJ (TadC family)